MKGIIRWSILAGIFIICCGFSPLPGDMQDGGGTAGEPEDYALRLEVPRLDDKNRFIGHGVEYEGDTLMNYCLEYDTVAHHARWVAYRFDAVTRMTNVSRSAEPFSDDPDLYVANTVGSASFGKEYLDIDGHQQTLPFGKFDRGHICASADRYVSREANAQTFYMTNISPQLTNFNAHYWSSFENYVRKRGRDAAFADTLYVVKGGTIAEGQTMGQIKRSNGVCITIPRYYFMALLRCKNNRYSALAFWMEHKDYGNKELTYRQMAEKAVSIDELEALTGIDFFHNLPDDIELEVEKNLQLSVWGLQQ